MATDATGTPTTLGIPTYDVNVDAPSGNGFNAAMAEIDTLIQGRIATPAGIAVGEYAVWNGTAWARSSLTAHTSATRTVITTVGSGTYTLPAGVQAILVELLGGGGTGGTAQTGSQNTEAAGSGGWGGAYAASLITGPAASYTYTVGAGGASLANGGTAPRSNAGGDTVFGASIVVAKGGPGGTGDNNSTLSHGVPSGTGIGSPATGNVGGLIVPNGQPVGGLIIASNLLIAGAGGDGAGPYGGSGAQAVATSGSSNGAGPIAGAYGAGSSGSLAAAFSSGDVGVAAANGGLIVITEFH
jgi:hypothetical protein